MGGRQFSRSRFAESDTGTPDSHCNEKGILRNMTPIKKLENVIRGLCKADVDRCVIYARAEEAAKKLDLLPKVNTQEMVNECFVQEEIEKLWRANADIGKIPRINRILDAIEKYAPTVAVTPAMARYLALQIVPMLEQTLVPEPTEPQTPRQP